jgi:hypothetical protein
MVPMHLGLIEGPFVPHNPISAQESPVPLLNFHMAPDLTFFCPLGPREEPRYTFFFSRSQKVLANKHPPCSPTGPLWRQREIERPIFRAFLYLSKPP